MPGLSSFAFLQPWLLVALIGLPALWFLLRITPPAPKRLRFPAVRLLQGLTPPEETPARTPWWLLALRMAALGLLILGLAGPTLFPAARLSGSGPLILVVDTGWAAGKGWDQRVQSARAMLDRARRDGRRVILLTTARPAATAEIRASDPLTPRAAGERLGALAPQPWPRDLDAARAALDGLGVTGSAHAVWLADGLSGDAARAFARDLQRFGRLDVRRPDATRVAKMVMPPDAAGNALDVQVRRAAAGVAEDATVIARESDGTVLGSATAAFGKQDTTATAGLKLPVDLRNRVARIGLRGEAHAGAVSLLDARWQRQPVGLVSDGPDSAQPLLSELYYLERALKPYATVRRDGLDSFLTSDPGMIVVADRGKFSSPDRKRVSSWIRDGGVLLRFAGPKLADDLTGEALGEGASAALLPVALRRGGRALGGAMSWEEPAKLAPFPPDSPFAGLDVPAEVTVSRQVLAQPSLDLENLTWARLSDGTPLVTAAPRGEGWVVLVHTTANTRWSDLPLSGLFVRMLRRVSAMGAVEGGGGGESAEGTLPPHLVLDGRGELVAPGDGVQAIPAEARQRHQVEPAHPPGLYGGPGQRRAHNLGPAVADLAPLSNMPPGVLVEGLESRPERKLGPWLLAAAMVLLLADLLIALALRGLLPRVGGSARAGGGAATAIAIGFVAATASTPVTAAEDPETAFARKATLETHLAYVETGIDRIDTVSRQGLYGLSQALTRRTAVEPGDPMGVNLRQDPLDVFPLLYWPVTSQQPGLTDKAARKVTHFLRNGGTILFDLRQPDTGTGLFGDGTQGSQALRRLTRGIEMPPLRRIGGEHVLTKAFYLLQDFPGRYDGDTLWIEDTRNAPGDGVASVIVGSSNWAGAWAVNNAGQPRFAVTPGGERQREMAHRFGVNLVMYALTGNYKADQVHVPAILERLGQ